jgi:uncharacterized protein (TIGR02996 family)
VVPRSQQGILMNETAFLDTIFEHPDDDVARLACADWLLERGDPASAARGEFIQVQVELARRAEKPHLAERADAERLPALKLRESALLAEYGARWAKPVAGLVESYQFQRGFIDSVALSASQFLKNAAQVLEAAPLRRVRLTGGISKAVADSPHLARLRGLDLSKTYMGDNGLRTLLASPHLGRLTWLDLASCYITDRGVALLAEAPLLARLEHLNLGYNRLTIQAVQILFGSRHWGAVRSLVLTGNYQIDSRAQQFLGQMLQGAPEPRLLRSMLQMTSREEREYTNAHVRDLAQRASQDPQRTVDILAEGLADGRRTVRSAAAQMLVQLGGAGAGALPRLVQRLFEDTKLVRDQVAPALARLLPHLSDEMQTWLCLLANPLLPARTNLRAALESPRLPPAVREGLAAVCARRAAWYRHLAAKQTGPAPVPEPGSFPTDLESLRAAVNDVLELAAAHASRHGSGVAAKQQAGRNKEAAWLLARLTELLQARFPG